MNRWRLGLLSHRSFHDSDAVSISVPFVRQAFTPIRVRYNFMLICETGHSEKDLPTVRTTTLIKYMHGYLRIHP